MTSASPELVNELDLARTPKGEIRPYWLQIVNDGLGVPMRIPVMVARGRHDGPVLGLTAAIHGNELNGIPVIQNLFRSLDPAELHGVVVGGLVLNPPGVAQSQRGFIDGVDLNRIAPGKPDGSRSQVFVNRIVERIIRRFDLHIDLHTASFGRVNSHYVRANMSHALTAQIARLQSPQIIVHNEPGDGTLRGAAEELGIASITVELRNPNVFERSMVDSGLVGIQNVLFDLGMMHGKVTGISEGTVYCRRSYWIYTDEGGLLWVHPKVTEFVEAGQVVAEVHTIFGEPVKEYRAPDAGVVIGHSVHPINQTGSRILHLGVEATQRLSQTPAGGRSQT